MTPVECYRWGRARLVAHVTGADPEAVVAACPGWRVRDVVAHVTGVAADFLSGRLPSADLNSWTGAQVDARRHLPFEEVLSEWDVEAPRFEATMAGTLAAGAPRFAADVVSHAFDVATALRLPADRTGPAVEAAIDTFVEMLDTRLGAGGGRVEIRAGSEVRVAGSGGPEAVLTAEPFDALRTLSGRRTEQEIRGLAWEGDLDAVIGRLSPFPLPDRPLGE